MRYKLLIFFSLIFIYNGIEAQTCTNRGQNPSSAFPVCGTQTFAQQTVALCGGRLIPTPCTDNAAYSDINPYWYKFTCFKTGSLGFFITPNDLGDDYDWQLFDITGHQPDDVYTDKSLFVTCNWSARPGVTGASLGGSGNVNCAGFDYPNFTSMHVILKDHNYLLLVSHFTLTQSGYKLDFKGGTAVITDTTIAHFQKVEVACDNNTIGVKLNKKMQCRTLDADASDFMLSQSTSIKSAEGLGCNLGFDMDSIILTLNTPIAPGNYTLGLKNGTDNNTLLDICDAPMDANNSISFTVLPLQPPVIDSVFFKHCPPDVITVRFNKKIDCNSVDDNGSDFLITGPDNVKIQSVIANCNGSLGTNTLDIQLAGPITTNGNYQLHLLKGNDDNTVVGICGDEVLPAVFDFKVLDPVSADFRFTSVANCNYDSINFESIGGGSINNWQWTSNDISFGNNSIASKNFPLGTQYDIRLTVSNGVCSDTRDSILDLPKLKAMFTAPDAACPKDTVSIVNQSTGNIINYLWNFGNGNVSTAKDPPAQVYPITIKEHVYTILLQVTADGCVDSVSHKITIFSSCYIDLPNSFTPNGDGLNDFFYPLNAFKTENLNFEVFNRWGNKVFEGREYNQKWDGTYKGEPQPAGLYIWILSYSNKDTHQSFHKKGTVMLIR